MPEQRRNPYHPDIALFLILLPFISAINYYLTYSNIKFNGFLLLTFTLDTVQGYAGWWAVRSFILFLDRKYPYERSPRNRILIQLVCTMIIGLAVIALLTEIVSLIAKGKPAPLDFYTIDLLIIGIWFIVLNGIYVGLHFYNRWQMSEALRKEENRVKSGGLIVKQGKQDLRLEFDDLTGLFVEGEYVVVCQNGGKKYYLDQSLDRVEDVVPATLFFRLNRQFILHRRMITGFKRAENGKLTAYVAPHEIFPAEIAVSRTKAPAFKSWFKPE
ncbi:MAG TPA: LytTR family DNA-binding domain-containing protein [Cyclobacteriaceae bacterium]|nr:LytTR family DNA-binding domain-containing protein [Cyclobacteriaceae bacterium]